MSRHNKRLNFSMKTYTLSPNFTSIPHVGETQVKSLRLT